MRRILAVIIVLTALLLLAEVGVTILSQCGMERAIRAQYEMPDSLEVGINSFPYIVSLARNHLGELRLSWEDVASCRVNGREEETFYRGEVNLIDVELNMISLLRGRLDIRSVSRVESSIYLEDWALEMMLGGGGEGYRVESGVIYRVENGRSREMKVKVIGDNTLIVSCAVEYDCGEDNAGSGVEEENRISLAFDSLPLDAGIKSAVSDGKRLVIGLDVPVWEGYMKGVKRQLKEGRFLNYKVRVDDGRIYTPSISGKELAEIGEKLS